MSVQDSVKASQFSLRSHTPQCHPELLSIWESNQSSLLQLFGFQNRTSFSSLYSGSSSGRQLCKSKALAVLNSSSRQLCKSKALAVLNSSSRQLCKSKALAVLNSNEEPLSQVLLIFVVWKQQTIEAASSWPWEGAQSQDSFFELRWAGWTGLSEEPVMILKKHNKKDMRKDRELLSGRCC